MRKISELSPVELKKLLEDYDNNVAIKKIISDYGLSISPSKFTKSLPPIEFDDVTCPYCNIPMVAERKARSSYFKEYTNADKYCPQCLHKYVSHCGCSKCTEKKREAEAKKKILVKETYSNSNRYYLNLDEISFEHKIYIGAICRMLLNEEMTIIFPYNNKTTMNELTPNMDWTVEIYKELFHANIISVHPDSAIDAFIDGDKFPNEFKILKVSYYINIREEDIKTILNGEFGESEELFAEDKFQLWKRIALNECIQYLIYQLNESHFDFSAGDKTITIFENILKNFSVSQIYGIIWRSVASAAKYYQEGNITKKQAANTTIGACQRYAEKAVFNSWNLTEYSRIKELPQSELATFLYNKILKIGELGFTCVPER